MIDCIAPGSLVDALEHLATGEWLICAGGTDLMVQRKRIAGVPASREHPVLIVTDIPELRVMEHRDDSLSIGAAVTLAELETSDTSSPGLRSILRSFASPAIRSTATIGGNICNASPAGDLLPYLYVRNAMVEVADAASRRTIPIAEFITGPGKTVLSSSELLTRITLPRMSPSGDNPPKWFYRKVAARRSNALSKLSVYAEGAMDSHGRVVSFAAAVGSASPRVIRSHDAESILSGTTPAEVIRRLPSILSTYHELLTPIDDQRSTAVYRRDTAVRLLSAAIEQLLLDSPSESEAP